MLMQTAITGHGFNICYIFDFYFTENFIHNNVKSFRMKIHSKKIHGHKLRTYLLNKINFYQMMKTQTFCNIK